MKPRSTVGFSFFLPAWLREPLLSIGVAKEVREIFPYWLVSALTSALWLLGGDFRANDSFSFVSLIVGELATVAMGAAMFGHEFTHRTLSLMLVQPATRSEIWQRKMAVLAAAMGVTLLFRLAGPILHGNAFTIFSFAGLMSISGILYGLTVAPWLTLLSRSVLAGTVFTVCLPVITWQVASLAVALAYGLDVSNASALPATQGLFVVLTVLQWLAAPFLSYLAFRRLQATDSLGLAIRLPQLLRPSRTQAKTTRRRSSAWAKLIGKELRLLSPAYVVAGLYLLICGADIAIRWLWPSTDLRENGNAIVAINSVIYGLLISLLAGSLACAEERHMGTLLWQLVQPMAAWRQWLVKAGVALGVALVLGLVLPALMLGLESFVFQPGHFEFPLQEAVLVVLDVMLLCLLGLYVSSVAGSTIRAMLWATPIAIGLEALAGNLVISLANPGWMRDRFLPYETLAQSLSHGGIFVLLNWTLLGGLVGGGLFVLPILGGYQNFRRLDQRASRVLAHLAVVIGYSAMASVIWLGIVGFASWLRASRPAVSLESLTPEVRQQGFAGECVNNRMFISNAIRDWSRRHHSELPPNLAALSNELASPNILVCPADTARQPAGDWAHWTPTNVTYEYTLRPGREEDYQTAELRCPVHDGTQYWNRPLDAGRGLAPRAFDATSATNAATGSNLPPVMDMRMLMRYGLVPKGFKLPPMTNTPADGEIAPSDPQEK